MARTTYKNLRIWGGVADGYAEESSITVEHGRIAGLGLNSKQSIDCNGLTVIPGLIDAHVHMTIDPGIGSVDTQLRLSASDIKTQMPARAHSMLKAGITTARDLGGGHWLELELRDAINRGEVPGPRLLCAGRPITSVGGHCFFWNGQVRDHAEVKNVVALNHQHGVDLIKVMATGGMYTKQSSPNKAQFSVEQISCIVTEAQSHGYDVAAHCHATEGIVHAAKGGVNTIEHCSWLGEDSKRGQYDKSALDEMVAKNIAISPTINSGWARFDGKDGKFKKGVRKNFRRYKEKGIRLIASTDAGIPGVYHNDLPKSLPVFASYAELTPLQVLKSATSECAKALKIDHVTGKLSPGLDADLVFLEGDPLEDTTSLLNPVCVIARGDEHWIRN